MSGPLNPQSASEGSTETTIPPRIGAGSFAAVYASPGRAIAIKVVHSQEEAAQIRAEYEILHAIHTQCDADSFFAIPRALAFYDPQTHELHTHLPPGYGQPLRARALAAKPYNPTFFANLPARACYVMDRCAPLPPHIGEAIRTSMYPAKAVAAATPIPIICRLYFGKEVRPSAFVNPANFPLDVARYRQLVQNFAEDLPPIEEVIDGMAELLAKIHWDTGYDGRDIEFVLAGAPYAPVVRFYLIDFNQVREFDRQSGDVTALVDAFFANDPYYPRPIPGEPLYDVFKQAYLRSCRSEYRASAERFLRAIEEHQASRAASK
ncbi:hypothetical protein OH77DRAFT_1440469 [Trametes cingulata]|nr:hypothetical protein OH77DRAFT_1440469 [Trametes cingulata]